MPASSGLGLRFVTLDVFSSQRFLGNQLAVVQVPKDKFLSQEQKQAIAIEYKLSETVFLHEADPAAREWVIDIFTIEQELPFAGHPTIGTACYLGSTIPGLQHGTLITQAGRIPFTFNPSVDGALRVTEAVPHIYLHQQRVTREQLSILQPGLSEESNLPASFPVFSCGNGMNFALFELQSLQILGKVCVSTIESLKSLVKLDDGWDPKQFSAYYFTVDNQSSTDAKMHVRARMVDGVEEDPATGSAACTLAGHLALEKARAGLLKGQSLEVEIEQGVEMGRASKIEVKVAFRADHSIENIFLTGNSVIMMSGELV